MSGGSEADGRRGATLGAVRPAATTDLRLVVPALVAWATAALAIGAPGAVRWLLAGFAAGVAAVALWRGARRPRRRHRARWQRSSAVVVLAGALSAVVLVGVVVQDAVRTAAVAPALEYAGATEVVLVTAEVPVAVAGAAPDGQQRVRVEARASAVTVRGEAATAHAPVLVIAPPSWAGLPPGTTVAATARWRATEPGDRSVALVIVDSAQPPRRVAAPPPWQRATHTVRTRLAALVTDLPGHAALVPGIGVGDDSAVPAPLADAMRTTSLGHLLAVSGAHVAIVLGGVLVVTGRLRRPARAAICTAVLAALVALVGPDPSVVRAGAMGLAVVLALVLGRRTAALPALATAVVALVLLDPWIAREPGFALSVCATAGLVLGAGPLGEWLGRRMPPPLAVVLAIPLAAQLACLPVLVLLDPGLATYGVLANALVAPVVPPLTVLALAAAVLAPWWATGAAALVWTAQGGTWWIEVVATRVAGLPLARLPWPPGLTGLACLVLVALAAVALVRSDRGRQWRERWRGRGAPALLVLGALVAVVALAASLVAPWRPALVQITSPVVPASFPPEGWRLVQCDVGQGSALAISTAPGGGGERAVMIDVGPVDGDAAGCLRAAGIAVVEQLVLTHADADHVGGLEAVIEAVDVEHVLVPVTTDPRMVDVVATVRGEGIAVDEVAVSEVAVGGDDRDAATTSGVLDLTVLWPTPRAVEIGRDVDANELSLTLWVTAPDLTVLVHGDLGATAQQALLRAWPGLAREGPDVLVVSHHGSPDQDETLLATTAGRVALISVGADNDYGHPAPSVLAVLAAAGSLAVRTDACGTVAVVPAPAGALEVVGCRDPARLRATGVGG